MDPDINTYSANPAISLDRLGDLPEFQVQFLVFAFIIYLDLGELI